jgi:hypothetical protein
MGNAFAKTAVLAKAFPMLKKKIATALTIDIILFIIPPITFVLL